MSEKLKLEEPKIVSFWKNEHRLSGLLFAQNDKEGLFLKFDIDDQIDIEVNIESFDSIKNLKILEDKLTFIFYRLQSLREWILIFQKEYKEARFPLLKSNNEKIKNWTKNNYIRVKEMHDNDIKLLDYFIGVIDDLITGKGGER